MPRVIAGSARGIQLAAPEGLGTRPTADRLKEALFSVIQFELPDSRFLDLFAGSGGAGVEALSRGARSAVFVEKDTGAADCIRKNLEKTKLASRGRIFVEEAELALDRLAEENAQFDVIFMDPPYRKGYEEKTCEAIMKKGLLAEKGLMIVESALETEFAVPEGLETEKVKQYRIAKFTLLRRNEGECK